VKNVVRGNTLFAMQIAERKKKSAPRLNRSVGTFYILCNPIQPIHLKREHNETKSRKDSVETNG
jgi:hypothetical protein